MQLCGSTHTRALPLLTVTCLSIGARAPGVPLALCRSTQHLSVDTNVVLGGCAELSGAPTFVSSYTVRLNRYDY